MPWDLKSDRPIYSQLIEQIELNICSGVYPLGLKMPSVRDLANEASVNPNTMQRALAKLEEDGLLYTNRTSGRFVTEDINSVKKVKTRLAQEHAHDFLKKMSELGFDPKEIMVIVTTLIEEMKN